MPAALVFKNLELLGVVDSQRRLGCEQYEDFLILRCEFCAGDLLGEIEVAQRLISKPHGCSRKALHWRMARGKFDRSRVSGDVGLAQRIMLASALVRNPSVLLLDEATNWLDNESREKSGAKFRRVSESRISSCDG